MEQSKVNLFLAVNSNKFSNQHIMMIKDSLDNMSDDKYLMLSSCEFKTPNIMLLISIFLGNYGIDRFLLGQTGLGVGKLLTCGGLGIWTIIDWFSIQEDTRQFNFNKFMEVCNY